MRKSNIINESQFIIRSARHKIHNIRWQHAAVVDIVNQVDGRFLFRTQADQVWNDFCPGIYGQVGNI